MSLLLTLNRFLLLEGLTLIFYSLCKITILQVFFAGMNLPNRSIRSQMFYRIGALKNFTKFTGKHLYRSLFFDKVAGFQPETQPVIFAAAACKSIFFSFAKSFLYPGRLQILERSLYTSLLVSEPVIRSVIRWFDTGASHLNFWQEKFGFRIYMTDWLTDWLIYTSTHTGPHSCTHTQTHTHTHTQSQIHTFKI